MIRKQDAIRKQRDTMDSLTAKKNVKKFLKSEDKCVEEKVNLITVRLTIEINERILEASTIGQEGIRLEKGYYKHGHFSLYDKVVERIECLYTNKGFTVNVFKNRDKHFVVFSINWKE